MLQLKPLIVVTGSVHVEGGDKHVVRQKRKANGTIKVEHTRSITERRRKANVHSTSYMRRIERLRILKTPFGNLVDAERLPEVKALIAAATRDVADFNAQPDPDTSSRLYNCMLWEHLRGNRLAAVMGWIQRGLVDGNKVVKDALPALEAVS